MPSIRFRIAPVNECGAQLAGTSRPLAHAIDPASTIPNLGSSGAIAGALGAYLVFYPGARVRTLIFLGFFFTITTLSAFIVIGLWFVLQLISSVGSLGAVQQGGVAYFAHVGGFVAGVVIAFALRPFLKPLPVPRTYPAYPIHPDLRQGGYWPPQP